MRYTSNNHLNSTERDKELGRERMGQQDGPNNVSKREKFMGDQIQLEKIRGRDGKFISAIDLGCHCNTTVIHISKRRKILLYCPFGWIVHLNKPATLLIVKGNFLIFKAGLRF